jgi:type IV secretion system protein VirD4
MGDSLESDTTASSSEADAENGGIRREPMLPEHEAIAPEAPELHREFALFDDEPDDEPIKARALGNRMRSLARQAAMDPDDDLQI